MTKKSLNPKCIDLRNSVIFKITLVLRMDILQHTKSCSITSNKTLQNRWRQRFFFDSNNTNKCHTAYKYYYFAQQLAIQGFHLIRAHASNPTEKSVSLAVSFPDKLSIDIQTSIVFTLNAEFAAIWLKINEFAKWSSLTLKMHVIS